MKKTAILGLVFALTFILGMNFAIAGTLPGNEKLKGPHWQFNIIGHPNNNFSGDNSNGRTIMVPLKTATGPSALACKADGVQIVPDDAPTFSDTVAAGARIYFEVCNDCTSFQIPDRDALDGRAKILVPASLLGPNGEIQFDIYLRVLGKPNTCMQIDAYAYDEDQLLYFWAGSAYISRKTGKSVFVKANELFDVWFCQVDVLDKDQDGVTDECIEGTEQELSVFNNVFEDYFWNVLNNGTRNVQVRIYY